MSTRYPTNNFFGQHEGNDRLVLQAKKTISVLERVRVMGDGPGIHSWTPTQYVRYLKATWSGPYLGVNPRTFIRSTFTEELKDDSLTIEASMTLVLTENTRRIRRTIETLWRPEDSVFQIYFTSPGIQTATVRVRDLDDPLLTMARNVAEAWRMPRFSVHYGTTTSSVDQLAAMFPWPTLRVMCTFGLENGAKIRIMPLPAQQMLAAPNTGGAAERGPQPRVATAGSNPTAAEATRRAPAASAAIAPTNVVDLVSDTGSQ